MSTYGEQAIDVHEYVNSNLVQKSDIVAIEEPMEIRIVFGPASKRTGKSLAITMRTPGHDFDLAAGFLRTEGIVQSSEQIEQIEYCGPIQPGKSHPNTVRVYLRSGLDVDYKMLQRHFYTTSSCGVCGKASLDALTAQGVQPIHENQFMRYSAHLIRSLPDRLRADQTLFARTGGIHAAGLIEESGELISVREDVGRHNALDKLIGHQMLAEVPYSGAKGIVVSGRASFELLQKALVFGSELFVSVGAPSSLAVELAERNNITLVGFASANRFNIYANQKRVVCRLTRSDWESG